MSRIGKMPVPVPTGVSVTFDGQKLAVKGPKGQLALDIAPDIDVVQADGTLTVSPRDESNRTHALHGLTRTLINNMVTGVSNGFEKTLEIEGVGYRAQMAGDKLALALGFSHPVEVTPEAGISFRVEPPAPGRVARIIVAGNRQAEGRRSGRPDSPAASPGAVQGQRAALSGRVHPTQSRQGR